MQAKLKLISVLLLVACFSLATCLQPLQPAQKNNTGQSANVLALLLGDARKMFAQQMFAKADAYFHRGNYPSIFDQNQRREENHMASEIHHDEHADNDHDDDAPAPARDWIESFGRHFYPTIHVHLKEGEEREMLPWLRVAVELDPHSIETYVATAYWLSDRLNKIDEGEQFLRDGLRANPGSPDLVYELGRLLYQKRNDPAHAKNLWLLALRRWREVELAKKEPNVELLRNILGGLAKIETQEGRGNAAVGYLKQLKEISPSPEQIQKQIDQLSIQAEPRL